MSALICFSALSGVFAPDSVGAASLAIGESSSPAPAPPGVPGVCAEVLPGAAHGAQAVAELGMDLADVATVNGLTPAALRDRLLGDPTLWVDTCGRLFYVDPVVAGGGGATTSEGMPYPSDQTFLLHSRPGANRVIYLDFNGELISGTAWNGTYNKGNDFTAPAYDTDGLPSTFSEDERTVVQSVWQRVAEDYAPFNVDVTTEDPGLAAIDRSGSGDSVYGTRALITNDSLISDQCGCGGVAYVGVFDATSSHQFYQPAWVFQGKLGGGTSAKPLAEAASHEVGHNLGLGHDGTSSQGYYPGHGSWAPIMGVGYSRPIVQWSKGEYTGANNTEDDYAVVQSNGAPLRADDYPNTRVGAFSLGSGASLSASGFVGTSTDVDWFSFSGSGQATVTVTPAPVSPNLDIRLELYDATGALLASADPPAASASWDIASGLDASLSIVLPASGTYFVSVDGIGFGDPLSTGYSDYGSVGPYSLSVATAAAPNNFSISASPGNRSVVRGSSTTYTVSTAVVSGSAESVVLSVTAGLPSGATASFSPASVTAGGSSTLTVATSGSTPVGGPSTLTIQGAAPSATHSTTGELTVLAVPGFMRVTSSPPVPAQISLNGEIADSWGLNWAELPPGQYTVHFSHVEGFSEPNDQVVTVTAEGTTMVSGTFTQRGTLRVTTSPAVAGLISVDAVPRNNWGMWTDLPVGAHEVCFGAVTGFTAPACQSITVNAGALTTVTGTYTPSASAIGAANVGYLRVTTSPALPTQISLNGVIADSWGLNWLELPPGQYTIHFSHVEGYSEPPDQTVTVTAGEATVITGTFTQRGTLRVTTSPAVAGLISVDGVPRNNWGMWTDLPTGAHQVCFGPVAGHNPPACQNPTVNAGLLTTVIGTYE